MLNIFNNKETNIFVLYSRLTSLSGAKLGEELGVPHGKPEVLKEMKDKQKHINLLIRWGCSAGIKYKPTYCLNNKEAISLAVNKKRSREVFLKENIDVPARYRTIDDIQFPCVIRPNEHKRGEHFHIVNESAEMPMNFNNTNFYAMELLKKRADYRIYIFKKQLLRAYIWNQVKETADQIIRNDDKGWELLHLPKINHYPATMLAQAFASVKSLGLDFGTVDMGYTTDCRVVTYEVNSGGYLNEIRAKIFAQVITEYAREIGVLS